MTAVLLVVLRVYRATLSPDHGFLRPLFPGGVCRFTPTCSEYLSDALSSSGLLRGLALGLRRVLRCHPLSPGGVDPVPPAVRTNTLSPLLPSGHVR